MKRLDFSRIKKAARNFVKSFAKIFKKKYSDQVIKNDENKAPSGNYSSRKGGYKYYTHIMKAMGNYPDIYRSFNRQKLLGSMLINGKRIYRIERNPHFAN